MRWTISTSKNPRRQSLPRRPRLRSRAVGLARPAGDRVLLGLVVVEQAERRGGRCDERVLLAGRWPCITGTALGGSRRIEFHREAAWFGQIGRAIGGSRGVARSALGTDERVASSSEPYLRIPAADLAAQGASY